MDWRNMETVRRAIIASGHGPQIEILHIADANHNVQVDNPLGVVDAVMASCSGKVPSGKIFGRDYYYEDEQPAKRMPLV